jgi:hypothetical protein
LMIFTNEDFEKYGTDLPPAHIPAQTRTALKVPQRFWPSPIIFNGCQQHLVMGYDIRRLCGTGGLSEAAASSDERFFSAKDPVIRHCSTPQSHTQPVTATETHRRWIIVRFAGLLT